MIAALLCSIEDANQVNRDTLPVLGRPLFSYPLLAALNASRVDLVAVSTNSKAISDAAEKLGAQVIIRPEELTLPSADMGDVVKHALLELEATTGETIDQVVLLLGNAPTISAEFIDHALEMLDGDDQLDSIATVALHNEFNPSRACFISQAGSLLPMLPPPLLPLKSYGSRDALGNVYFLSNSLRIVRRRCLFANWPDEGLPFWWTGRRTAPIVDDGGFDVDYSWQLPGVTRWLVDHGFTAEKTPYSATNRAPSVSSASSGRHGADGIQGKVLVTTVPFGQYDRAPLDLLEEAEIPFIINPIGRKLRATELADMIEPYEALIAGTEPITAEVLHRAKNLKLIARVGIGLDSVDLKTARELGIQVCYTPDAPSAAVAELTMAQMLAALRYTHESDRSLRSGAWKRRQGRRLAEMTVGIIGLGRIGQRVAAHLTGWPTTTTLANDTVEDPTLARSLGVTYVSKEELYRSADIITLHLPLTPATRGLIGHAELAQMKPEAILINTSRGGIVDEGSLSTFLQTHPDFMAAIDVFLDEPYGGSLTALENCLLTCHMGSCTRDCRQRMEMEATQEVIRYFTGRPSACPVPDVEYNNTRS